MSLKSIRTFGWLTGDQTTVRSVGTYGYFVESTELVPISSVFLFPVSFLQRLDKANSIPLEFGGTTTLFSVNRSLPIDFTKRTSLVDNILVELHRSTTKEGVLSVEFNQLILDSSRILVEPQLILELLNEIPVEFDSPVFFVSTNKTLLIDTGQSILLNKNIFISIDNPVINLLTSHTKIRGWKTGLRSSF